MMGNMISDYVKGKKKFDYPPAIQSGIMLHRFIDQYTDSHEATKEAKKIFQPHYRLYSGAFVDVVYDHFLATDKEYYTKKSLFYFSQKVYTILDNYLQWMPEKFLYMYPFMKEQNWLYNYRFRTGIEKSMGGVVRRAAYLTESKKAFELFEQHYQLLSDCSRHFLAAVTSFARNRYTELLEK